MKGELTTLRCLRIAEILKAEIGDSAVTADTQANTITIQTENDGVKIVVRPLSVEPVR